MCDCAVSLKENERWISCNCACGEKGWDISHLRGFHVALCSDEYRGFFKRGFVNKTV